MRSNRKPPLERLEDAKRLGQEGRDSLMRCTAEAYGAYVDAQKSDSARDMLELLSHCAQGPNVRLNDMERVIYEAHEADTRAKRKVASKHAAAAQGLLHFKVEPDVAFMELKKIGLEEWADLWAAIERAQSAEIAFQNASVKHLLTAGSDKAGASSGDNGNQEAVAPPSQTEAEGGEEADEAPDDLASDAAGAAADTEDYPFAREESDTETELTGEISEEVGDDEEEIVIELKGTRRQLKQIRKAGRFFRCDIGVNVLEPDSSGKGAIKIITVDQS